MSMHASIAASALMAAVVAVVLPAAAHSHLGAHCTLCSEIRQISTARIPSASRSAIPRPTIMDTKVAQYSVMSI